MSWWPLQHFDYHYLTGNEENDMGYIERLTKRVEPYTVELQPNWQQHFRQKQKVDPEFSQELLVSLEGWLSSHVVFVKMQRETLVSAKSVKKAMTKIADEVARHGAPPVSADKLCKLLKYWDEEEGVTARAHNVALDWIACGLPSTYSVFGTRSKPNPADAETHLTATLENAAGFAQLKSSISGQQTLFDSVEKRRRLEKLDGRRLPNGSTFSYKPDPRQQSNAQPESAARYILAAALRDLYKCTGFPPNVPRDGRSNTSFLRFLEAARLSLPSGYQTSLVSPARRAEIDEKKNGPGTLERFKSRLYHSDCWRT
jgi:hypothetical protein